MLHPRAVPLLARQKLTHPKYMWHHLPTMLSRWPLTYAQNGKKGSPVYSEEYQRTAVSMESPPSTGYFAQTTLLPFTQQFLRYNAPRGVPLGLLWDYSLWASVTVAVVAVTAQVFIVYFFPCQASQES